MSVNYPFLACFLFANKSCHGVLVALGIELLPEHIRSDYEVYERHHACAVLFTDFPGEWGDLITVLEEFRLRQSHIQAGGGNKSAISRGINGSFYERGWQEKRFEIRVTVDEAVTLAPTHHVDYFKSRIAVETEWNNKDPFFDRDLNTFRLLHDLNVLSVGVLITRADDLEVLFKELGEGKKYGQNTTHMGQLIPRMNNRGSGGCPVLAFGITRRRYDPAS